ncbi:DUF4221 family protein [Peijinzhouia sedimentorum]
MQNKLRFLPIGILCGILFSSCDAQSEYENPTVSFEIVGEKKFPLDSITKPDGSLQYIKFDSSHKLAYSNQAFNRIYLYDFQSTDLENVIEFDKEGPNGTSFIPLFSFLNKDSLLISIANARELSLFTTDAKLLWKQRFPQETLQDPFPSVPRNIVRDVVRKNSNFVLSVPMGSNTDKGIVMEIGKNDGNPVDTLMDWPEDIPYNTNFVYPLRSFWETQLLDGSIAYSFATSHHLVITDDFKSYRKAEARGNEIGEIILSDLPDTNENMAKISEHFAQLSTYGPLITDPYRKLYYRIAYQAVQDPDRHAENPRQRITRQWILVFDEEFKKLGEIDLGINLNQPISYVGTMAFATNEGLVIRKAGDVSDDFLHFDIMNIKVN